MSTKKYTSRKSQDRSEVTRGKLLDAAARIFSEQGYDGVSVKDLETSAGVQRGLLAYHFGDKETLWRTTADRIFGLLDEEVSDYLQVFSDLPARERLAMVVRFYIRFSARHPEFSRLMTQEARQASWRNAYIAEHYVIKMSAALRQTVAEALGLQGDDFMHWFYALAGASALIFSHAPEAALVFKRDTLEEAVVERHAELLVRMLVGAFEE